MVRSFAGGGAAKLPRRSHKWTRAWGVWMTKRLIFAPDQRWTPACDTVAGMNIIDDGK